jgi:Zn-dependent peptidase ImmA (M78 family)/transcriptional regulator with XRE-family HTH domain
MSITKEELGQRLKAARENVGLTQEAVAQALGLSRGAIAQLEGGMRFPNSQQLVRLGELYGREVGEFLQAEFRAEREDALAALFRADAALAAEPDRAHAVRECATLCREYTVLEELLGRDVTRVTPATYTLTAPRTRWDAIRQGEQLADRERGRLELGVDPIGSLADLLERQGVRILEIALPEDISGLCLHDRAHGLAIIVNSAQHSRRRLFSYAHEYCHLLADRERGATVSRAENREELLEIRANAFAAAFLLPEDGIRDFLRERGKGDPGRSELHAFDGRVAVAGQKRQDPGAQELQVADVVALAHHFGVSYESTLYRLLNLKLLSEADREHLAAQRPFANRLRRLLEPDAEEDEDVLAEPRSRYGLAFLALEAFRAEAISRGKFSELCALAHVPAGEVEGLIAAVEAAAPERGRVAALPKSR